VRLSTRLVISEKSRHTGKVPVVEKYVPRQFASAEQRLLQSTDPPALTVV
jgi:hypothetical protein